MVDWKIIGSEKQSYVLYLVYIQKKRRWDNEDKLHNFLNKLIDWSTNIVVVQQF
jgi:hypothetical protein